MCFKYSGHGRNKRDKIQEAKKPKSQKVRKQTQVSHQLIKDINIVSFQHDIDFFFSISNAKGNKRMHSIWCKMK